MTIDQAKIDQLISILKLRYPDWNGFADPRFVKQEVDYKRATISKARDLLSKSALDQLIAEGKANEVIDRLGRIGRDNNLLYLSIPKSGDLSILFQPDLNKTEFAKAIVDLLHGEGPSSDRFARYVEYLQSNQLANRWTFPTYFLFITHPESEMFVKPKAIRWLLRLLGCPELFTAKPTASSYEAIRKVALDLKDALAKYEPHDLVEIQGLVWVCFKTDGLATSAAATESNTENFPELFEEFSTSYALTEKGKAHLRSYSTARQELKENFALIAALAGRGEDVTDQVLLKLLPHANTASNQERGVWVHPAPAITGDVKELFEGAGWTRPEDWPRVATAILNLIQQCTRSPEQLAEACKEFSSLPYSKGFQTGMLTPAFNALRPDEFLLINNKSRRIINYFTESNHAQALESYPRANEAGRELIKGLSEQLVLPELPDIRTDDLFDMFCHWMVTIKKYPMGTTHYWKVSPGERALEWEKCRDGGSIGLAWNEVGDMSSMTRKEFEARRDEVLKRFPDWTATGMEQLWKFARIPEGDKIVANRGTTEVMGIGTVVGPYFFQPDANYAHRLPVEWDDVRPRAIVREAWRKTLIPLSREEFEEICRAPIKELEITYTPPEPPPSTKQPVYSLQEISKDTGFDIAMLERWVRALNRKRQAIIYGPPGTGKTYIAERLAKHLIGGSDGFFDLVQFHPAYAYEDFIQGIRPQVRTNGDLDYQMVPGRFLDFCSKATRAEGTCVLIIDEINRAKLSHVFGELMYLLEYRDQEVPLAGGGLLRIPRNVRIIGTMNTADRSIALADHALRRRFASFHLAPNYEVLRRYHEEAGFPSAGLVNVLTKLNKQIADAHYEIGISFFLRRDIAQQVEDIWKMEIEPYLEEYFFDQPDKVSEFRWEKVGDQIMNPQ